jgi:nickel/cobalt transporter (NiCoT) family protein
LGKHQSGAQVPLDLGLTALSAAIGFVVGTIQIAGLVRDRVRGVFWQWFSSIDLDGTGVIIVALFVAIWLVAILAANRKQAATRRRR